MTEEHVDTRVAEMLTRALPEMEAGWEEQAVAAVAAGPAHARSRGRLLAMAAVGAAVLVALGFVPVPLGQTKGALDRAVAAMEQVPVVYVESATTGDDGAEITYREWGASDGRVRTEEWRGGKLTFLQFFTVDGHVQYDLVEHRMFIGDYPPPNPYLPVRRSLDPWDFLAAPARYWQEQRSWKGEERVTAREWKEGTLWGGIRQFIEERRGDSYRLVYELDPATGRVIAWTAYHRAEGAASGWEAESWTERVEWDPEVPEGLWTPPEPSPGMKLIKTHGWSHYTGQTLASETAGDWRISLHAVEHASDGSLFVMLSALPTRRDPADVSWQSIEVDAITDSGTRYIIPARSPHGQLRGYSSFTLRPGEGPSLATARTVTVTARPTGSGAEPNLHVTLPSVPMPAPDPEAGNWGRWNEEVQY